MSIVFKKLKNIYKRVKDCEVGCGQGHFIDLIVKNSNYDVKGFDTSYKGESKLIKKMSCWDKISSDMIILGMF